MLWTQKSESGYSGSLVLAPIRHVEGKKILSGHIKALPCCPGGSNAGPRETTWGEAAGVRFQVLLTVALVNEDVETQTEELTHDCHLGT